MLEGPCRVRDPGACSELAELGGGAVSLGDPAGSGNPHGLGRPCRVWGPGRILSGLGVFIGESAVSTPSPLWGSEAAGSGQPLWGRTPSLSLSLPTGPWEGSPRPWASKMLLGLCLTLGLGCRFHVPLCKSQWGNQAGSASLHCHHPQTVILAPDCAPPRGQKAEEDWSSQWHRHCLPPTKLDFWDCFDDRPGR